MPKTYTDDDEEARPYTDDDAYRSDVADRKATLEMLIADSKWVVEFTALLVLYVGVTTVAATLLRRIFLETGPNIKLICGAIASISVVYLLFGPTTRAMKLGAEAILLQIRRGLFIPHDLEQRSAIFRGIWLALLNTIEITAIWGTGLLGSELIKNSSLP